MTTETYNKGTGRRKCAIAQVRIAPGTGLIVINGKPLEVFFPRMEHRRVIIEPLKIVEKTDKLDVTAKIVGGGVSGQAGALRHGIARALVEMDETLRTTLRSIGSLTRDPRAKERKKYGLVRARKAKQFTKR
ncbi:MAG: 30S ribosomal protein S9 [Dehalococcoidia bacterium]|nr:30S ribosomal protein S9 [Dehalococcoidia bacterium]